MSTPRRRVLRPSRPDPAPDPHRQQRLQRQQAKLDLAHAAFNRWMTKLKRAFHAVERTQEQITRLERQIQRLSPP